MQQDATSQELSEMVPGQKHRCECCDRSLHNKRIKWLELNCDTGAWSDPDKGHLPAELSQGCFPFGVACAAKALRAGLN